MRTWILFVVIIVFLTGLITYEDRLVDNFCADTEKIISSIATASVTDDIEGYVELLEKTWYKNKDRLFVFFNHNSLYDFEKCMLKVQRYYECNDNENFFDSVSELIAINHRLINSHAYNPGNIF